ncbi:MAG: hypothetical protein ABSD31_13655 [Candidatus Binataceae bacterium]|jgi:hypothetical protein
MSTQSQNHAADSLADADLWTAPALPAPLDLMADAIEAYQRSPIEREFAYAHVGRAAIAIDRTIRDMPCSVLEKAARLAHADWNRAAALIRDGRYLAAYEIFDRLPARLRTVRQ